MIEMLLLLLGSGLLMLRLGSGGSFPKPLKPEEEEEYLRRWLEESDYDARNILIERNLRLVAHVMKKYYTAAEDMDDLISIGTIGLIKAINTYRPDKGVKLATYAGRCIENEVLMYFRAGKKTAGDVSLSDSMDLDGEGGSLSLMDVLCREDEALERIGERELLRQVREGVEALSDPRQSEILRLRYGLSGKPPMTQRDTAKALGISRSYVSRLEKKALEQLQRQFADCL